MLLLTMTIGAEIYGLDAQQVIEVIPLVVLKQVPRVDAAISGIFNYRGTPVPVIDLCVFLNQKKCRNNLGSRIIITQLKMPDQSLKTVGLLAEHVTEVIKCNASEFTRSGINAANAEFLQNVYQHQNGLIQIIDVPKVIPDSISRQLTTQAFT